MSTYQNPWKNGISNLTQALFGSAETDAFVAQRQASEAKREQHLLETARLEQEAQRDLNRRDAIVPLIDALSATPRMQGSGPHPSGRKTQFGDQPMFETPEQVRRRVFQAQNDITGTLLRYDDFSDADVTTNRLNTMGVMAQTGPVTTGPLSDRITQLAAAFTPPSDLVDAGPFTMEEQNQKHFAELLNEAEAKAYQTRLESLYAPLEPQEIITVYGLDGPYLAYEQNPVEPIPGGMGLSHDKPNQRRGTPRNYVATDAAGNMVNGITLDGMTDARTGQLLPQSAQIVGMNVESPNLEGAVPGLKSGTETALEKGVVTLETAQQALKEGLAVVQSDQGSPWQSTGLEGWIAGNQLTGILSQIPVIGDAMGGVLGLSPEMVKQVQTNRSQLMASVSIVGRYIANGPNSERYTDADRKAAEEAASLVKAGTSPETALAILKAFEGMMARAKDNILDRRDNGFDRSPGGGGTLPTPTPNAPGAPTRIRDDAEYDALPPGTRFIDPDGNERVKPNG